MTLPALRVSLAFVLAMAPVTLVVIADGPSLELFAAFGSGVLFSVWCLSVCERAKTNAP